MCDLFQYGYAIITLEWLVFLGNTERANGKQWKESFDQAPTYVHWVMDNGKFVPSNALTSLNCMQIWFSGYKKPLGIFAIVGLHVLPIWLYMLKMKVLESFPIFAVTVFLLVARIVCGAVEVWCLWKYVELLLHRNHDRSDAKNE